MILYTRKTFRLIIVLAVSLLIFSCDKGSEKDIPSYISLGHISLKSDFDQGTSSSKISDVWIYIDTEYVGTFELRDSITKIPILQAGKHKLTIYPGIKMNGIAATRVPYTFYNSITKDINLVRDSVLNIGNLVVKYSDNAVFEWLEDFDHSISIDTTARSLYKMQTTSDPDLIFHYPGEVNSASGIAIIPSDTGIFECVSHDAFSLPVNGTDVFLELNYKTNNPVTVGLFVYTTSSTIQEPLLVLNRNTAWNKIYINLTAAAVNHQDAINFKIFFGVIKESDVAEAQFLVDNIKLVHF
jgi:hypothetical protein